MALTLEQLKWNLDCEKRRIKRLRAEMRDTERTCKSLQQAIARAEAEAEKVQQ
jgi:septal ring factor EnvC (AmiA/AmiB activator)